MTIGITGNCTHIVNAVQSVKISGPGMNGALNTTTKTMEGFHGSINVRDRGSSEATDGGAYTAQGT